ncbi:MAG: SHOCT domain-containing protein [Calditrichaeota bacterium]|nr:SHOCT domain-containing protein [Calditrichota bacterium]
MMHGFGWGGMWFGSIFWLLFLGVIIWGILSFTHNQKRENREITTPRDETPLEILKKRYAKGELTQNEFDAMRKKLIE